jgi:hypothetical protein
MPPSSHNNVPISSQELSALRQLRDDLLLLLERGAVYVQPNAHNEGAFKIVFPSSFVTVENAFQQFSIIFYTTILPTPISPRKIIWRGNTIQEVIDAIQTDVTAWEATVSLWESQGGP